MNNKNFNFDDLPFEAQDESISENDFKLVDNAEREHEQKFQTKPTTFFKDSVKRFTKNKSSVVAAGILGVLLLLVIFVPIFNTSNIEEPNTKLMLLEPKLFDAGTGFWDGTKKWEMQAVDCGGHENATTEEEKQEYWYPAPDQFIKSSVTEKTFTDVVFTDQANQYGSGGYVQFGFSKITNDDCVFLRTITMNTPINLEDGDIYLNSFNVYDLNGLKENDGEKAFFPENYVQGKIGLYFEYTESEVKKSVKILDYSETFNVTNLNVTDILLADSDISSLTDKTLYNCSFSFQMENNHSGNNECVLIKNISFGTNNFNIKEELEAYNFDDATKFMLRKKENNGYMESNVTKKLHMSKIIYCDFVYDSYDAVFGVHTFDFNDMPLTVMNSYMAKGLCRFSYDTDFDEETGEMKVINYSFVPLSDKCPVKTVTNVEQVGDTIRIFGTAQGYLLLGYDEMPKFLLGTDNNGYDMVKYVFSGLGTSLLLGIASFAVCFVIGLIWGAISGYFGGTVDLIMERITDVISGLPWIVVMTLAILLLGQNFITFGLAICLTGWIGTAATTRTQFYRFRGREYVLASRSLGANDFRLIFKHILPNAMGTIITSSVLMIPSTIFSEATISYLGLGLQGMSSLGVILSNNQKYLTTYPYLLIFPAIVIALLMISFNLFGNGLRDAVNPSLKGED